MAPFARLSCFVRRPRQLCSHVILKIFMTFAAFNQGAEFSFSKRQTAPACVKFSGEGRGCTLGTFGWGCAAGTLEPLAHTRARSSEFCYPILDLNPKILPPPLSQSSCFPETTEVTDTVQPKQIRFDFFHVFEW